MTGKSAKGAAVWSWLAWSLALGVGVYVIVAPLAVAGYPMITEFPFHVAVASVFRHFGEPTWHFAEQFTMQPLAAPFLSLYALSALLMTVLSPVTATKVAVGLALSLLPIGLMVLCWGMRKSPLIGLWGLALVWAVPTELGAIHFVAGLGLSALAVGLAFRLVDKPTRGLQWGLALCVVLLFFTNVFMLPFVVATGVLIGVAMYPASERITGLLIPLLVGIVLFGAWWATRIEVFAPHIAWSWPPDWSRFSQAEENLYDSLVDVQDLALFERAAGLFLVAFGLLATAVVFRLRNWPQFRWVGGAHFVVFSMLLTAWALYFTLPMEAGVWSRVYPMAILPVAYLLPALLPNLPRRTWVHLLFVGLTALAVLPLGQLAARTNAQFALGTTHFRQLVSELPDTPKLMYLVFDHTGSASKTHPYIHLPAYVQAEHGGWLSYHAVDTGALPLRYRSRQDSAAVVPPATPSRWEWAPQQFALDSHGAFFDWFLVRKETSPDELFSADSSIRRVARFESWWLYRRGLSATGPRPKSP